MGKLHLRAEEMEASPPPPGFSVEWGNAWAKQLHF